MLQQGDPVREFQLPGTDGEDTNVYRLGEFTDCGVFVVVFYPFDFSPVCTTELCRFRDAEFLTFTENVDVAGISTDSVYAHERFSTEYNLPFPLLSDSDGSTAAQFGVRYGEWENHPGVAKRAVFVVDSDDRVQYRWATDDAYDNPDINEIYERLKELPEVDVEGGSYGIA